MTPREGGGAVPAGDREPGRAEPREPDAVLAELGARLSAGYAAESASTRVGGTVLRVRRRHPGRPAFRAGRRGPGWLLVLLAATFLGGPAAFATRDALRTDAPPAAPAGVPHAPGARVPDAESGQVLVNAGTARGVAWSLSASGCRYGTLRAVGLFLTVPGGGGGARCDAASLPPAALAARRVQAYYDPVTGRTWVFGALPAAATQVALRTRGYGRGAGSSVVAAPVQSADPASADRGIPAGLRTFVVALDGSRDVAAVTARAADRTVVLACHARRCALP